MKDEGGQFQSPWIGILRIAYFSAKE